MNGGALNYGWSHFGQRYHVVSWRAEGVFSHWRGLCGTTAVDQTVKRTDGGATGALIPEDLTICRRCEARAKL